MWFDLGSDEAHLTCPTCGGVGNGLLTAEDGQSTYFCLTCLTRSTASAVPAPRPSLVDRLTRLAGRKR